MKFTRRQLSNLLHEDKKQTKKEIRNLPDSNKMAIFINSSHSKKHGDFIMKPQENLLFDNIQKDLLD